MSEAANLRDTIVPKSDQLNADDLLAGPITVRITGVKRGSPDQPVDVQIEGRQPYKPCKSMRRVLIAAWGDDGRVWIGRSMTLYCDPAVKFGGVQVGGIRISHLSDLDADLSLSLTATRGKREPYKVRRLMVETTAAPVAKQTKAQAIAAGREAAANGSFALAEWWTTFNDEKKVALQALYDDELVPTAATADARVSE